jgi:hypothetical protein
MYAYRSGTHHIFLLHRLQSFLLLPPLRPQRLLLFRHLRFQGGHFLFLLLAPVLQLLRLMRRQLLELIFHGAQVPAQFGQRGLQALAEGRFRGVFGLLQTRALCLEGLDFGAKAGDAARLPATTCTARLVYWKPGWNQATDVIGQQEIATLTPGVCIAAHPVDRS